MSPTVSSSALMVTFSPSLRHRAYWGTKLAKLSMILLDFDSCQLKVKTCPSSVYPDSDLVVGEDPGDDDDSREIMAVGHGIDGTPNVFFVQDTNL